MPKWYWVTGGICSVCYKFFRNTPRMKKIMLDLDDNKHYCKGCAIGREWDKAVEKRWPKTSADSQS